MKWHHIADELRGGSGVGRSPAACHPPIGKFARASSRQSRASVAAHKPLDDRGSPCEVCGRSSAFSRGPSTWIKDRAVVVDRSRKEVGSNCYRGDAIMRGWRFTSAPARSVRGRMLVASAAVLLLAGCAAPNTRGAMSSSVQPGGSVPSDSAHENSDGWTFHDTFVSYPYSSASDATLGSGDLTMTPHVADPTSCPLLFHSGEVVDISGDGFAPAATVTLMLTLGRAGSATRTVQAGQDGNLALTVTLPSNLTGLSVQGSSLGYLEAHGEGSDSPTGSVNAMCGVGAATASCGATPSITVYLVGPFTPKVSSAGAVFA